MLWVLPRIAQHSQMASAINFHHLISWLNSANFAHGIGQSFDVIHAWLQGFWVWS
jgi:hypothetical protein